MMKRLLPLLLALLLCAPCALSEMERVVDPSNVLTADTEARLTEKIQKIADQYQFDVVILNIGDIGSYTTYDFAADYYDYGGYGYGETHDGIMLLLVTDTRDYYLMNTGSAERIFKDSVLTDIEDDILPYLRKNRYEEAEELFVQKVENRLEAVTPLGRAKRLFPLLMIVGAGIALIVVFSMKAGMKSVRRKRGAANYIQDGSFRLDRSQDIFLYSTTTRRRIETQSGPRIGGSGGGGGFTGHSGTHHTGHGGKF